jgi:alkanesulfonate monooxygenase SsuD/methylene tetrahydromethanopterin reductase-like flavin-dependent oxidoreductase (luciferase family)
MRTWYFSENAYPYLPEPGTYDSVRVTLPNRNFDPVAGAALYDRYLEEYQCADDLGLSLMVNEHHATSTNLNPSAAVILSALARTTKNARLLILGNPIGNRRDPVRVAEEMAMIDCYSHGRLEVGFVRSAPYEFSATNSSPARLVDRLWEAHDLIIKAWTSHDGPFNWEGRYFHHRQVNIWPRPYQQPHPPVWFGFTSAKHIADVADRGYGLTTGMRGYDETRRLFDAYRNRRAELGLPMSDKLLANIGLCYVGDTDEEGYAGAEKLLWYINENKAPPQFRNPPGYVPAQAAIGPMRGDHRIGNNNGIKPSKTKTVHDYIAEGALFAGNPDTVSAQIRRFYDHVGGFGNLIMWGQAGLMTHEETIASLKRFAREVQPRLDAFGPATREPVAV